MNQLKKSYSLGDVSETASDDFSDAARRRRDTVNSLGENDDVRVWEGQYVDGGKVVERELLTFIDDEASDAPAQNVTKDDASIATRSSTTKTQPKQRKGIEIYASVSKRTPIARPTTAATTKKQ